MGERPTTSTETIIHEGKKRAVADSFRTTSQVLEEVGYEGTYAMGIRYEVTYARGRLQSIRYEVTFGGAHTTGRCGRRTGSVEEEIAATAGYAGAATGAGRTKIHRRGDGGGKEALRGKACIR